jgi:hypothetical protein
MYDLSDSKSVLFHAFESSDEVKKALHEHWARLKAIDFPGSRKAAISCYWLTNLATVSSRSDRGQLKYRGLRFAGVLMERWHGEHFWLDAPFWQPPPRPMPRVRGAGRAEPWS